MGINGSRWCLSYMDRETRHHGRAGAAGRGALVHPQLGTAAPSFGVGGLVMGLTKATQRANEHVPFDLDDPPIDAPDGCLDLIMWAIAREHYALHEPIGNGGCEVCGGPGLDCDGLLLARHGLAASFGVNVPRSSYWTARVQMILEEDQ